MSETRPVPDVLPVTGVGIIKGSRLCNFVTGQSFLLMSHQSELDKILEVIRKNPGYWVEIEGFASRAGDASFNKTLSEARLSG
jgi:outer membrane protein OmpA-like peptidoglycan-associated protein